MLRLSAERRREVHEMSRSTSSLCVSIFVGLGAAISGCAASTDLDRASDDEGDRAGSIGLELNWSGRDFSVVSWTLTGIGATTQHYEGDIDISESDYFVSALLDGIATGSYRLEMESTSDSGTQTCRGHVPQIDVESGKATDVSLLLLCSTPNEDGGSMGATSDASAVNISAQFDDCTGMLHGITASPASAHAGEPITLTLDVDPGFSDIDWTATSGSFRFSDATPTMVAYTCSQAGVQTLTATVSTSLEDCDPSTRDVMVTCE
jgi:hypothetical protein